MLMKMVKNVLKLQKKNDFGKGKTKNSINCMLDQS